MNKKRILFAEDDQDYIELIESALTAIDCPYSYQFFRNGEHLLNFLEEQEVNPELIISDIKMPKITGLEVLKVLKSNDRFAEIPVVLLSNSNHHTDKEVARQSGCASYEVKPPSYSGLKDLLKKILKTFLED